MVYALEELNLNNNEYQVLVVAVTLAMERKSSHHRSSSVVKVQHVEQTAEQMQDAEAGPNANAEWVYQKGTWLRGWLAGAIQARG